MASLASGTPIGEDAAVIDVEDALRGRVALVTGGGSGLGRACALRLAASGLLVAVSYSVSRDEAEGTAAEIEAAGGRAVAVRADIADPDAVRAMTHRVENELGPVDVLIGNAGTTTYVPYADLDRLTVQMWERILRVNVVGTFLCVQAVAAGMVERGFGRVVLVSSNSAFSGLGSSIPYAVSKGAVATLTQSLAHALAPAVTVNAVAPGWMLTPWIDKHVPADVAATLRSEPSATVDVSDVARLIVELAANGSITGQTILAERGAAG